jgi:hypothetical protein
MKSLLPWAVAVLALGAAWFFHSSSNSKHAVLAQLLQEVQELESLRAENSELKATQISGQELERLRKDNRDLPRLRSEIQQLRNANQQLTQQAAAAQGEVQRAQARATAAQLQTQALATNTPLTLQQMSPEQLAAFRQRYGLEITPQQQLINTCINNLRQLDGAKQQWALETKKTEQTVPGANDILEYLKDGTIPTCPAGGRYTLNAVAVPPTCTIPGHTLPQ